jgi:hypothetical protein
MIHLIDAIGESADADIAFAEALRVAGFKSRWDWMLGTGPKEIEIAYRAKVVADNRMHEAFAADRARSNLEGV